MYIKIYIFNFKKHQTRKKQQSKKAKETKEKRISPEKNKFVSAWVKIFLVTCISRNEFFFRKHGASAMSSEASEVVSVTKKEHPLAEYTHCRNLTLNLAISCYTCKNQSI